MAALMREKLETIISLNAENLLKFLQEQGIEEQDLEKIRGI